MDERGGTNDSFTEPELPSRLASPQRQPHAVAPHRKRGGKAAPAVLVGVGIGVGGLVAGLLIGYGVGYAAKPAPAPAAGARSGGPAAAAAPTSASAKIGDSIALAGTSGDQKLTVTLVKVADPATSADQYTHPGAGKRWVAVEIRVTDTAAGAYSDSPANGATLVDAQGRHYSSTYGNTTLGPAMGSDVQLAPGGSALGVIVYEVPTGQKVSAFQFSLDSGLAAQTGQWQLS